MFNSEREKYENDKRLFSKVRTTQQVKLYKVEI